MAEVFKAHVNKNPNVIIAIKRILPHFSQHKELVKMLINEARLTVGLSHPNVVPVLDFGVVDNNYFLAMEYVYGKDLKSIMNRIKARKSQMSIPLCLHIMTKVLRGLDYAHHKCDNFNRALQIVHRDISPQNIMLSFQGQIKILDFGIAKTFSKSRHTEVGILKGKFCYMSPEQAYGKEVDPRTDIFSAGIVLWELLTLENCFAGETDLEIIRNVREAKVQPVTNFSKEISMDLSNILSKALQKKPRHRYTTAGDFADALQMYQEERFGPIHDEDVSAFLQSLYSLSPNEIQLEPSFLETRIETGLSSLSSEPSKPSFSRVSTNRAPWAESRIAYLQNKPVMGTLLILGMIIFFSQISLVQCISFADRQAIRMGGFIYRALHKQNNVLSKASTIYLPSLRKPLYKSTFSSEAQQAMDELPFEQVDQLNSVIEDLSFNPTAHQSRSHTTMANTRFVQYSNFELIYQLMPSSGVLHIKNIKKISH